MKLKWWYTQLPSKVTIICVAEERNYQIKRFRNLEMRFRKIIIFFFQYKTARSGGKELQAILHKRKEMADRKDDSVEVADYSDSESKWLIKYNPM